MSNIPDVQARYDTLMAEIRAKHPHDDDDPVAVVIICDRCGWKVAYPNAELLAEHTRDWRDNGSEDVCPRCVAAASN